MIKRWIGETQPLRLCVWFFGLFFFLSLLASSADVAQAAPTNGGPPAGNHACDGIEGTAGCPIFVVNSDSDSSDDKWGDGKCLTSSGKCTLRAAVQESNTRPGPEIIHFNIRSSNGSCPSSVTINLGSTLKLENSDPAGVTIDGYTQCGSHPNTKHVGSDADIRIHLQGSSNVVLDLGSANNTVRGFAITGGTEANVMIQNNGDYNALQGNFIGLDPKGNGSRSGKNRGLWLNWGAEYNLIGGPSPADRNVIGNSGGDGIDIYGYTTIGNRLENNYIGVNPEGNQKRSNGDGIDMQKGANYTVIINNLISGNGGEGVEISHDTRTTNNQIIGNVIGPAADGSLLAASNTAGGMTFDDSVNNNLVADNILSGNEEMGLRINAGFNNIVERNLVGLSLPFADGGVSLIGFRASDHFGASYLTSLGNGTDAASPTREGIHIFEHSQYNIVRNNVIANNPSHGIFVSTQRNLYSDGWRYAYTCRVQHNMLSQNIVYNNGGKEIRLGVGAGVTETFALKAGEYSGPPPPTGDARPSIPCPGTEYKANEGMNAPTITSATPSFVSGQSCPNCTVEVFLASEGNDDDGRGGAIAFIGSGLANNSGNFTIFVSGVAVGQKVTATATNPTNSTSELALNKVVGETLANCDGVAAPASPTLTAARSGDNVQLSWTAVADAFTYIIYRSDNPYFDPATTTPYATTSSLSFTDTGALANTTTDFFYSVRAANTCGKQSAVTIRFGAMTLPVLPGWNILTLPLAPLNGNFKLDAVIGTDLYGTGDAATADEILTWNSATKQYESAWFCAGACLSWGQPYANHWLRTDYTASPITLTPGKGFWVQNRSSSTEYIKLLGIVPTQPTSLNITAEWDMIGSAFPNSRTLGQLGLPAHGSDDPLTADRILFWNAASQSYETAWFCTNNCGGGQTNVWLADNGNPSSINLRPGVGFWYQNRKHTPLTWVNSSTEP